MKRVVITGATGAIGIALIHKCIQEKVEVLVLAHRGSKRNENIPKSPLVTVQVCDLEEFKEFQVDSGKVYDVFYHFAWKGGRLRDNVELQMKNISYAMDAMKLAKRIGCKTFVGAGSQAEYGGTEELLSGNTATFPKDAFGASKLYAGYMCSFLAKEIKIKYIWTRILSVYGPYDGEKTMIISTIQKLLKKEVPQFTLGEQRWDFLYSSDAAEAMYLLGENGKEGKIYCVGSGQARLLKEYIEMLRDEIDETLKLEFGKIPYKENQVMNLCADISALKEDTGFIPKVDFSEGIQKTISWCKKQLHAL